MSPWIRGTQMESRVFKELEKTCVEARGNDAEYPKGIKTKTRNFDALHKNPYHYKNDLSKCMMRYETFQNKHKNVEKKGAFM